MPPLLVSVTVKRNIEHRRRTIGGLGLVRAKFATFLKRLARMFTPTAIFPREIARTRRVRTWIRR